MTSINLDYFRNEFLTDTDRLRKILENMEQYYNIDVPSFIPKYDSEFAVGTDLLASAEEAREIALQYLDLLVKTADDLASGWAAADFNNMHALDDFEHAIPALDKANQKYERWNKNVAETAMTFFMSPPEHWYDKKWYGGLLGALLGLVGGVVNGTVAVAAGVGKFVEGVTDGVGAIVCGTGYLISTACGSSDGQEFFGRMLDGISYDCTGAAVEDFYNSDLGMTLDDWAPEPLEHDGGVFECMSTVGQYVPAVVITVASGGMATGATAAATATLQGLSAAGNYAEQDIQAKKKNTINGVAEMYYNGEISEEQYMYIMYVYSMDDETWNKEVEQPFKEGKISPEEYQRCVSIKNMDQDWLTPDNVAGMLGGAVIVGAYEGVATYGGMKLNAWPGVNGGATVGDRVATTAIRVGTDAAMGATGNVVYAFADTVSQDKDFAQAYEDRGGIKGSVTGALIGGGLSLASEIPYIKETIKMAQVENDLPDYYVVYQAADGVVACEAMSVGNQVKNSNMGFTETPSAGINVNKTTFDDLYYYKCVDSYGNEYMVKPYTQEYYDALSQNMKMQKVGTNEYFELKQALSAYGIDEDASKTIEVYTRISSMENLDDVGISYYAKNASGAVEEVVPYSTRYNQILAAGGEIAAYANEDYYKVVYQLMNEFGMNYDEASVYLVKYFYRDNISTPKAIIVGANETIQNEVGTNSNNLEEYSKLKNSLVSQYGEKEAEQILENYAVISEQANFEKMGTTFYKYENGYRTQISLEEYRVGLLRGENVYRSATFEYEDAARKISQKNGISMQDAMAYVDNYFYVDKVAQGRSLGEICADQYASMFESEYSKNLFVKMVNEGSLDIYADNSRFVCYANSFSRLRDSRIQMAFKYKSIERISEVYDNVKIFTNEEDLVAYVTSKGWGERYINGVAAWYDSELDGICINATSNFGDVVLQHEANHAMGSLREQSIAKGDINGCIGIDEGTTEYLANKAGNTGYVGTTYGELPKAMKYLDEVMEQCGKGDVLEWAYYSYNSNYLATEVDSIAGEGFFSNFTKHMDEYHDMWWKYGDGSPELQPYIDAIYSDLGFLQVKAIEYLNH